VKEIFIIRDTPANKISYFHLLAFLVALPFDRIYSEIILASLLVHTLIHLSWEKLRSIRWITMFPAILYLVTMIGTIYTVDKDRALDDWEKQLALLLLPFIFSVCSLDLKKYRMALLKAFGLTSVAVILYCFWDAIHAIEYNKLPLGILFSTAFSSHNFSAPLELHATYLSMYSALSFTAFLLLLIDAQSILHKVLYGLGCFVLLAGIFQLSSRSVFIAMLLIVLILCPFVLVAKARRRKFMMVLYSSAIACLGACVFMGLFKSPFMMSAEQELTVNRQSLFQSRATRWKCAIELIGQSPLVGRGSGSEKRILKEEYFKEHLYNSYVHELDAHNEYLSFLLKSGLLGLGCYLAVLYGGFRQAVAGRDFIFCSFLVLVTVVSFSENILDVNKGIFFFGFFFSFFMCELNVETKTVFDRAEKFMLEPGT
jgi:O-antigen ligase